MNGVIDLVDSDEDDFSSTETSPPLSLHGRLSGGMSRSLSQSMRNTTAIRLAAVIPAVPALVRTGGRIVEVFDLISSDDEEPPEILPVRTRTAPATATVTRIHGEDSSENNSRSIIQTKPIENLKDENPAKFKRQRLEIDKNDYYAIKREFEPFSFGAADYLDEVVEVAGEGVEENELTVTSNSGNNISNNGADTDDCEIECLGGNMNFLSDMPHQREACSGFPFAPFDRSANSKYCKQCFCYVCDINAKECLEWSEHCNASHRIPVYKEEQKRRKIPALNILSSTDRARFFFDNKSVLTNEVRIFDISTWQLAFTPTAIRQLFKDLIAKSNEILGKSDFLLSSDRESKRKLLQQATVWILLVGNFYCTCVGTRSMDDLIESLLLRILFHSECDKTIITHLKINFQDEKRRKSCADLAKTTDILWDSGLINNLQSYIPDTFNQNELLKLSDSLLIGIMKKIVRTSTLEKEGVLFRFFNILMDFNLTVFLNGIYLFLENSFENVNEKGNESENDKIELNEIKWEKEISQVQQLIRSVTALQWSKDKNHPKRPISVIEEFKSVKIVSILTSILRKIPDMPSYNVKMLLMKNLHLKKSSNRPYNQSLSNFTFLSKVIYLIKNQFGLSGCHPADWVLNNFLKKWTPEEEYAVAISLSVRMKSILPCCFEKYYGEVDKISETNNTENNNKNDKYLESRKSTGEKVIQSPTFNNSNRGFSSSSPLGEILSSSPEKEWRELYNNNRNRSINDDMNAYMNVIKFKQNVKQNVKSDPFVIYEELYTVMDGPALLLLIVELKDICTYPSSSVIAVQYGPYTCSTYDGGKLEWQVEDQIHGSPSKNNDNYNTNNNNCDNNNNKKNNNNENEKCMSSPVRTSRMPYNGVSTYASPGSQLTKEISPSKKENKNGNENKNKNENRNGNDDKNSRFSVTSVFSEECFYHAFTVSQLYLPAKIDQLDLSWEGQSNVPPYARGTYVQHLFIFFFMKKSL